MTNRRAQGRFQEIGAIDRDFSTLRDVQPDDTEANATVIIVDLDSMIDAFYQGIGELFQRQEMLNSYHKNRVHDAEFNAVRQERPRRQNEISHHMFLRHRWMEKEIQDSRFEIAKLTRFTKRTIAEHKKLVGLKGPS